MVCPSACGGLRSKTHNNTVRIICDQCKMRCSIPKAEVDLDRTTALGKESIVKAPFPQTRYPAPKWEHRVEEEAPAPKLSKRSRRFPPPDAISRATSLPISSVPATSQHPPSTSGPLTIHVPLRPSSVMARSRSTSSTAHGTTPPTPPPTPSESSMGEIRKRPYSNTAWSKSLKKQKK